MRRLEQPTIRVVVHIDKARCDNFARGIKGLAGFGVRGNVADLDNAIPLDRKIRLLARGLCTVDDRAVANEEVEHRLSPF